MRRDAARTYWDNARADASDEAYAEAAEHLSEISDIAFSLDQAKRLLSLYPLARIKLAQAEGAGPTDVRDDLSDVLAHFFLGSRWPQYGDGISIERFNEILQKQALALGFQVKGQTNLPVIVEDRRPDVDCQGNPMANGDLTEIASRGFIFHAFIDDFTEEQATPARPQDFDNEQWFDSLDWSTARLLIKAQPLLVGDTDSGMFATKDLARVLNLARGKGTDET
jgi:hypothetical protein